MKRLPSTLLWNGLRLSSSLWNSLPAALSPCHFQFARDGGNAHAVTSNCVGHPPHSRASRQFRTFSTPFPPRRAGACRGSNCSAFRENYFPVLSHTQNHAVPVASLHDWPAEQRQDENSRSPPFSEGPPGTEAPSVPLSAFADAESESRNPRPDVVDHGSTAVISACVGNSIILLAKLIVYAQSNSSVMLAEAMHSLADLSNQCLLLVGLVRSRRAPDAKHPYGYSRERFVWALISAVGIFFCGSGMSVAHGVYGFLHPEAVESMGSLAAVLLVSTVIETATLAIALRAVRLNAAAAGLSAWQYVRSAQDPLAVAVLAEDGAAVLGLGIAGVCLSLMHVTGQAFWDPLGSILIGQLLGAVAVFLISQNRRALVGQSMSMQDMMRVMSLLQEDPVVRALHDCKSEVIGPGAYRFKAEIDFCGKAVVTNFLQRKGQAHIFSPVQAACDARDEGMLEAALKLYGEELVLSMGEEVDRLERKIQELMPEIRHVDIETHARGSRG